MSVNPVHAHPSAEKLSERGDRAPHARYPNIFRPLMLGPVEIPTRFFFAPHGSSLTVGTKPADDLAAYSAERVRNGGCGLVIVATAVHERARTRQPSASPPENIEAFRAYATAIHDAGGKAFVESLYWWGGHGQWQPLSPAAPAFGPSVRQFSYRGRTHSTRAMGTEEITAIVDSFRRSAENLRSAGIDGVMIHASHAALVEQFLSPYFNERTDEYGGDFDRRLRFLVEVLEATREGAGPTMAVGIRLNCDEMLPGGYGTDDARAIVSAIVERGLVDFIDLDVGVEPQQLHYGMPTSFTRPHVYRSFVETVRSAAGDIPVLSVLGRVTSMDDAEAAIADGVCDMVGAARQLIAEPRFVQNARNGKEAESRVCIACNWCMAASVEGTQGCAINPASYRERLWGVDTLVPAPRTVGVAVVGGGPGGMEAARVAALRGHKVVLFEARDRLGGALATWADLPGRETYGEAVRWWASELARLAVDVRLDTRITAADVLAESPGAVIVASGARYSPGGRSITLDADVPGWDGAHVFRPEDILLRGSRPSGRVVVFDAEGLHAGVGIAELLALAGSEVTLVSASFSPVSPRLTDNFEVRFIMQRLESAGVKFRATTWVRSIDVGVVHLRDVLTEREWSEPVDSVVLVGGREPQDELARELEGRVEQLFTIGDALSARMLAAATYEGQMFARLVGENAAPVTVAQAYFRPDPADFAMLAAGSSR